MTKTKQNLVIKVSKFDTLKKLRQDWKEMLMCMKKCSVSCGIADKQICEDGSDQERR